MKDKKKYEVYADADWIQGHLCFGHFEGYLSEEQYQEYLNLPTKDEQRRFISDLCTLIVDDWEIDAHEYPSNIQITEIKKIEHG